MSSESEELLKQVLGYGFFDRARSTSPGYAKLVVTLLDDSDQGYFSPEYLRASIFNESQKLEHLTIYHPWEGTETYQLGCDRIVLRDYKGLTIEGFTFGGMLQIVDKGTYTECVLTSEAPILELVEEFSITTLLAAEAESTIAEFRDQQASTDYEGWLAQANPLKLYAAIIYKIKRDLLGLADPDVTQVQLLRFISSELEVLQADEFKDGLPELTQVA